MKTITKIVLLSLVVAGLPFGLVGCIGFVGDGGGYHDGGWYHDGPWVEGGGWRGGVGVGIHPGGRR